jgi:hypothetical protein
MLHKHVVHFLRGNFFTTTIDELLRTASDEQVAIRIEVPLVAGPEPPMRKGLSRGREIIVVAWCDASNLAIITVTPVRK